MNEEQVAMEIWRRLGAVIGSMDGHPSPVYVNMLNYEVSELASRILKESEEMGWKEPPQEYLNERIAQFVMQYLPTPDQLEKEHKFIDAMESAAAKPLPEGKTDTSQAAEQTKQDPAPQKRGGCGSGCGCGH